MAKFNKKTEDEILKAGIPPIRLTDFDMDKVRKAAFNERKPITIFCRQAILKAAMDVLKRTNGGVQDNG